MKSFLVLSIVFSVVMFFGGVGTGLSDKSEDRIARMLCAEACNQPLHTQTAIAYVLMSAALNGGRSIDDAVGLQQGYYLSSWAAAMNKHPHMSKIYFGEAIPYKPITLQAVRKAYSVYRMHGTTSVFHFDDCVQDEQFAKVAENPVKWKNGLISFKVDKGSQMCLFAKTRAEAEAFIGDLDL